MIYEKKIKPISELEIFCRKHKNKGKKIVLCHGTFDLLHIGHLRYLTEAKKSGDFLIVTITADKFVLKGPGRPIFNENLRSEMLANLEIIDFVSIIYDKSALPAIEAIKPNVYFKGIEYKNHENDLTGKIKIEENAVKNHGGILRYSDDIVFSSSNLINNYINPTDDKIKKSINEFREKGGMNYFNKLLDEVKKIKILIIGEAIIDQYDYVDILGKSSKETIVATLHKNSDFFTGGVIASAGHLQNFNANLTVVTNLGLDDPHNKIIDKLSGLNVEFKNVFLENRPTIRKRRFVDRSYYRKMFEVYYMDDKPYSEKDKKITLNTVKNKINDVDIVIVNDFGHGFVFDELIDLISNKAKFLAVNTQTNSANRGFNYINKYPRADYVCIDEPEFRLATQDKHTDIKELAESKLNSLIDCKKFMITLGKNGCVLFENSVKKSELPAFTNSVVDTVGAGDAFFSVTSPFAMIGADNEDLCLLGNIAGALKVEILGHEKFIEKNKFIKYIETLMK